MKPLSRKILGLALLNVVLIAAAVAIFVEWQFGLSVESLLLGPTRDRIMVVASSFKREVDTIPYNARNDLLASYSVRYGAEFFLVDPFGESLAPEAAQLPDELLQRLRAPRPRPFPPRELPLPRGPGAPDRGPNDAVFLKITHHPQAYWIGLRLPVPGLDGEPGVPAVLLLRSSTIFNSRLFFDWRLPLLLALTLAALAMLCWLPFVRSLTRSIREMDRATREIAQGHFAAQVTSPRRDELGDLGEQINRMAAQLEGLVKNQKRFLGDIAHELCAPLARIQFALGILEQRVEEAQQAHVIVLRDEVQEMSNLINELLMFSKAGVDQGKTPLKSVDASAVVRRAVAHQLPGTGTIEVDLPAELTVEAHEPYLLRAVSNLLRNALRYAGDAGPIRVTARRQSDQVLISVSDCGPGLPEGAQDEVFAPFYRSELSRSRETGGAGLGLAIVKSCIEACRGSVVCRNRQPSGLEVIISLRALA